MFGRNAVRECGSRESFRAVRLRSGFSSELGFEEVEDTDPFPQVQHELFLLRMVAQDHLVPESVGMVQPAWHEVVPVRTGVSDGRFPREAGVVCVWHRPFHVRDRRSIVGGRRGPRADPPLLLWGKSRHGEEFGTNSVVPPRDGGPPLVG